MTLSIHSRATRPWTTGADARTLSGVSHALICTVLVAVLSEIMTVLPGAATGATGAAAGVAGVAGVTVRLGPRDAGDQPQGRTGTFGWPLPGAPAVVRGFDPPAHRFGPGHRGVDLAATPGTPVLAAGTGTVVFAGMVAGRGVVSVDHPGGLRTTYEPVAATVSAGARVARGEQIGTVQPGHPGCAAAACLHWGVLRGPGPDREYLDPLRLLGMGRVRLLPIDDLPGR